MAFSRASRDDLLVLKSEVQVDPTTLGFATLVSAGDLRGVSDILNTTDSATIDPLRIATMDLQGAVDADEFEALSNSKKTQWLSILQAAASSGGIAATNTNIKNQILNIWAVGDTRTNLGALQTRLATRMEVLFGEGAQCTPQAVGRALNQT